jgi:hypothetical protein
MVNVRLIVIALAMLAATACSTNNGRTMFGSSSTSATSSSVAQAQGWVRFRSPSGKFEAEFPGPYTTRKDGARYQSPSYDFVASHEVSESTPENLEGFYRTYVKGLASGGKIKILDASPTSAWGTPGFDYSLLGTDKDGAVFNVTGIIVLRGRDFYKVQAIVPADQPAHDPVFIRFFKSFKILG